MNIEKLVTNMDQHGRVLIPSEIRLKLNIHPGDKVNLEIYDNEVKIISSNKVLDEIYSIFTKNKNDSKHSIIDDFLDRKQKEYMIEEKRNIKNDR